MYLRCRCPLVIVFIFLLNACQKQEIETETKSDFGKSINYDSFLWKEERNDTLIKSFVYSFNQWASESNSFVTLTLSNESNKAIGRSNMAYHFLVNNKPLENGIMSFSSNKKNSDTVQLKIVFTEKINTDLYGFISISEHNVDRVNDIEKLDNSTIFKWSASQDVIVNPLKLIVLWVFGILVSIFIIYLLLLRPIIYRRFGRGMITIQQPFYKNTNIRGSVEIIFTNKKTSQRLGNRLLQGKKIYVVNDYFTIPISITPGIKGKVRIKTNGAYTVDPFTSNLEKGKIFKITNTSTNDDITISYL